MAETSHEGERTRGENKAAEKDARLIASMLGGVGHEKARLPSRRRAQFYVSHFANTAIEASGQRESAKVSRSPSYSRACQAFAQYIADVKASAARKRAAAAPPPKKPAAKRGPARAKPKTRR